jgi:hypothetical protein
LIPNSKPGGPVGDFVDFMFHSKNWLFHYFLFF